MIQVIKRVANADGTPEIHENILFSLPTYSIQLKLYFVCVYVCLLLNETYLVEDFILADSAAEIHEK